MRKILYVMTIALSVIICSCSQNTKESETNLEIYAEKLISEYPNYESNEMAQSAIKDSIKSHAESFKGKIPNDLQGLQFKFDDFREGHYGKCAVFTASVQADVDAPKNSDKEYLMSTIHIAVFGRVSDDVAAKLDRNLNYSISGRLHAWDGDNHLQILQPISVGDLDFGIYILDDMQVKEASNEQTEKL